MKLLFVVLDKHSAVDIVSYYGDFLDNGLTNHMRICACTIIQFAQKHNLSALLAITIYKLFKMVVFIVQTKAELFLTK